jgi:hypothetical protein
MTATSFILRFTEAKWLAGKYLILYVQDVLESKTYSLLITRWGTAEGII